ncbi:MAG TPA: phosphate ABC transporter substrate-binding protein PstS [Pseudonocardiaceae bacterium]|nr:phosphate ABC transporter substrate-binding protein PstS [Pseudonocardiaceae bacterium]
MKINYRAAAVGIAAAGAAALVLAGCGSDNNSTSGGSGGSATSTGSASNISCQSGSLTSGGSTAQQNAISAWNKAYETACSGATINYQGVGSGAGVTQFSSGTLDFAGSDFALDSSNQSAADARCKSGPAINIPLTPGGIAIGYNIPNVTKLNLSAGNLAKIFSGKITNWNDPAIAKDNSGVTLPNLPIQTFHRSDSSGTSYNFTNYLANEAKSDWTFGANKNWPAPGGQGEHGSSLVASTVKATAGGIGYFEQSFATQNNLPMASVSNAAGQFVPLTTENVANFLAKAKVVGSGNDLKLNFDYTNTDSNAYPNLLVTYEIVCSKGNSAAKLPLIKGFLGYAASTAGQSTLTSQGYVPLPSDLQTKAAAAVAALG